MAGFNCHFHLCPDGDFHLHDPLHFGGATPAPQSHRHRDPEFVSRLDVSRLGRRPHLGHHSPRHTNRQMSTQYTCPKCNGVNTDPEVLEGLVRCTGCGEWFAAEAAQMISEPTVETSVQLATLDESTQLAATADFFVWAAIIFVIIGQIIHIRALLAKK